MEIDRRRHLTPTSGLCTHTNGHMEAHISHVHIYIGRISLSYRDIITYTNYIASIVSVESNKRRSLKAENKTSGYQRRLGGPLTMEAKNAT